MRAKMCKENSYAKMETLGAQICGCKRQGLKETPSPYLEIVFIGQCEVFVCLAFGHFLFFFFFFFLLLGREAHRSANGVSIL